jgi:hypothetical protein
MPKPAAPRSPVQVTDNEAKVLQDAARRITGEQVFQLAITAIRVDAVERLLATDPNNVPEITRLQADVHAIDRLCERFSTFLAGAPQTVVRRV